MPTGVLRIVVFAAAVRVAIVTLAVTVGTLCPAFDASVTLATSAAVGPLCSWDGVHYLGIARNGYTSDHTHAFFPLYPLIIRGLRCV